MSKDKLKILTIAAEPNTKVINDYIFRLKDNNYDCLIAIGGGSTIDTAKALLAQKIYNNYYKVGYGENRDLLEISFQNHPRFIVLPTTAGTGSETSRYYLITDNETKEKTVSRSWSIVPEYVILDPYFLKYASPQLLVLAAFDAFIHLWETYICKYERSMFGDMVSLKGMSKIIFVMNKFYKNSDIDAEQLLNLQFAACLGGIAIANTRTGLMHDAGEALSAQVSLSHPQTLIIFFEYAFNLIKDFIKDREILLTEDLEFSKAKIKSIENLIDFWINIFKKFNLISEIKNKMKNVSISNDKICNKIFQDKVLINKESPLKLSEEIIRDFVERSLNRFK